MDDAWIERAFAGIDAEFVMGMNDGRNLSTPEPSANRHPAYRHAWEVHRAEVEGWVIPAAWARGRAKHIEAGGDFYPYPYPPRRSTALSDLIAADARLIDTVADSDGNTEV